MACRSPSGHDWKNDGTNLDDGDVQNFGTVESDLNPKPAYTAIKEMTHALDGYQLKERLSGFATKRLCIALCKSGRFAKNRRMDTGPATFSADRPMETATFRGTSVNAPIFFREIK